MRTIESLTDDEIENCIDGSSNIDMIKDILTKHGVVNENGVVSSGIFADWFAQALEGYIDAEPETEEWTEAFDNNWNWGYNIADNINDLLEDNNEI